MGFVSVLIRSRVSSSKTARKCPTSSKDPSSFWGALCFGEVLDNGLGRVVIISRPNFFFRFFRVHFFLLFFVSFSFFSSLSFSCSLSFFYVELLGILT